LHAPQDEVFERVGRRAVLGALDGFNGTVFAYGQTGSGKTFTITGGTGAYSQRGLIPRAISALFAEAEARKDSVRVSVRVSYLEIYNEQGYDLLGEPVPSPVAGSGEDVGKVGRGGYDDLPKVTMYDDDTGGLVMRGLAAHPAENAEEALNLLFRGDTARAVAATTSNAASSRSHCVFTLAVESRPSEAATARAAAGGGEGEEDEGGAAGGAPASEMMRRSKLHLVDLAGSERVGKTGIEGVLLTEAKAR
jgi:kinesin family protein 6/9